MAKILAPSLEGFGILAALHTQGGQGVAEAVGIEVRQLRRRERLPEYGTNGTGTAPVPALQPSHLVVAQSGQESCP